MNPLPPILVESLTRLSELWAVAIWRSSIDGAVAIGILWPLLRLLRRTPPRLQCGLWRAALGKMLLSLFVADAITVAILPASHRPTPVDPVSVSIARDTHIASQRVIVPLFAIWLVGLLWSVLRTVRAWRLVHLLREDATAPSPRDPARVLLEEVCHRTRVRHPPELWISASIDGPMLIGVLRPAILLPVESLVQFPPDELRMILAHELEHLRRRDLLWSWLPELVGALFFFHPMVRLARGGLALACEAACDEAAVARTRTRVSAYLTLLLKVASRDHGRRQPKFAGASIVESHATLRRRFQAVRSAILPSRKGRVAAAIGAGLFGLCGMAPLRLTPRADGDRTRVISPVQRNAESTATPDPDDRASDASTSVPREDRILPDGQRRIIRFQIRRGGRSGAADEWMPHDAVRPIGEENLPRVFLLHAVSVRQAG